MKQASQGVSLVELLISLTLGALLVSFVFTAFWEAKQSYQQIRERVRLHINGQLAVAVLRSQIQQAGFIGCNHLSQIHVCAQVASCEITEATKLQGYQGTSTGWQPPLPFPSKYVKPNTDALIIRYAEQPVSILEHQGQWVELADKVDWSKDSVLLISDCQKAELATVERISGQGRYIEFTTKPRNRYFKHAMLMHYNRNTFYIGDTQRRNGQQQILWGLYYYSIQGIFEELIPGVEDLKVYFLQAGHQHYQPASAVSDWRNIVSMRIHLLLVSDEAVLRKPEIYRFAGREWLASDRRLRQEWVGYATPRQQLKPILPGAQ